MHKLLALQALAAVLLTSTVSWAQRAQLSGARIGVLGAPEEPRFSEIVAGLRRGLRDAGHTEKSLELLEARVGGEAAAAAHSGLVCRLVPG